MADSHHDCIYLRNLHLSAIVGKDAWQRPSKPQPLIISIKLFRDIADAGETDDISKTSNYGQICKDVQAFMQEGFPNLRHLSRQLVFLAASKKWGARDLHITLTLPKGLLRAEKGIQHELITGCQPRIFIEDSTTPLAQETWSINDIKLACIIGVNAHERLKKQIVVVSLKFTADRSTMRHEDQDTWATAQWEGLVDRVIRVRLLFSKLVK